MSDTPATPAGETPPNLTAEQVLTEWLEMAKDGRLKAVALAGIMAEGDTVLTTFTQHPPVVLIAAGEIMMFRLKYFALMAQRAFG